MVCLVVDHDDILVASQLAEHTAREGLVALLALFDHGALLLFERHQAVPVLDQDHGLIDLLPQRLIRAEPELVVDVLFVPRIEHLKTFLHGQPRGHNEDRRREFLTLRIGQRVQYLPGNDQAHDCRLAGAGRHLVADALPGSAIAGDMDTLLELRRCLHPPDQRLDRL